MSESSIDILYTVLTVAGIAAVVLIVLSIVLKVVTDMLFEHAASSAVASIAGFLATIFLGGAVGKVVAFLVGNLFSWRSFSESCKKFADERKRRKEERRRNRKTWGQRLSRLIPRLPGLRLPRLRIPRPGWGKKREAQRDCTTNDATNQDAPAKRRWFSLPRLAKKGEPSTEQPADSTTDGAAANDDETAATPDFARAKAQVSAPVDVDHEAEPVRQAGSALSRLRARLPSWKSKS